jgi:hypothetical protein
MCEHGAFTSRTCVKKISALWDIASCSFADVDVFSEVLTASIIRVVTESTSETSGTYRTIRSPVPEGCHLHTHSREISSECVCSFSNITSHPNRLVLFVKHLSAYPHREVRTNTTVHRL